MHALLRLCCISGWVLMRVDDSLMMHVYTCTITCISPLHMLLGAGQLSSLSQQTVPGQKLWVERQQQGVADPVAKETIDRPPTRVSHAHQTHLHPMSVSVVCHFQISVRDAPSAPTETSSKPDPADVQALINNYCWTSATHKWAWLGRDKGKFDLTHYVMGFKLV